MPTPSPSMESVSLVVYTSPRCLLTCKIARLKRGHVKLVGVYNYSSIETQFSSGLTQWVILKHRNRNYNLVNEG